MASTHISTLRYIPIWSIVHSYHTFCTRIYNPNVHFTSKINIFTQKRKKKPNMNK